jgi:hypothetical protein
MEASSRAASPTEKLARGMRGSMGAEFEPDISKHVLERRSFHAEVAELGLGEVPSESLFRWLKLLERLPEAMREGH